MKKKILIAAVVIALTSIITSSGVAANNYYDNGSDADASDDNETAYADLSENKDSIGSIDTFCDAADILGGSYETAEEAETETFVETTSDSAKLKETANVTGEATEIADLVDEATWEETTELVETTETESEKIEETTGAAESEKTVETTAETKEAEDTTTAETTTVSTTTAETTTETVEETTASSSALISSLDIVQPLGDVNVDIVIAANKELEFVPEFLLDAFVENGWEYYVSEEDLATKFWKGTYAYGTVLGTSELGAHKIYLDNRTEAAEYTLHEFGHFVDKYYKYPSQTDEFASIYKSEASTFNSLFNYSHSGTNEYEIFAQSFQVYLKYPEKLATNCPMLYEFISRYVIE